jgi:hypothetical protein
MSLQLEVFACFIIDSLIKHILDLDHLIFIVNQLNCKKRHQYGDSIQFNSIQFNSIQFNSIQFNSIQFNSIQFNPI